MWNTSNPAVQIVIVSIACAVPAIGTTICRLCIRRGQHGADDLWALLSAIFMSIMVSGSILCATRSSPKATMIAAYYMASSAFYAMVWFPRITIVLSITRIHPRLTIRERLFYLAGIFFLVPVVFICQLFWVCERQPNWKDEPNPQCKLSQQVVILQLVTDITSDAVLVVIPLWLILLLSNKKLAPRLVVIFLMCLITTVVSLMHAVCILTHAGHLEVIAAVAEGCVSVIVCNIPALASTLPPDGPDSEYHNSPPFPQFATFRETFPMSTEASKRTVVDDSPTIKNHTRAIPSDVILGNVDFEPAGGIQESESGFTSIVDYYLKSEHESSGTAH